MVINALEQVMKNHLEKMLVPKLILITTVTMRKQSQEDKIHRFWYLSVEPIRIR